MRGTPDSLPIAPRDAPLAAIVADLAPVDGGRRKAEALCIDRADLAKLLNISVRQIYRLDDAGRIPAPIALGSCKRWLADEVHEWLRAGAPPRRAWENRQRAEPVVNLRSAVAVPRTREA